MLELIMNSDLIRNRVERQFTARTERPVDAARRVPRLGAAAAAGLGLVAAARARRQAPRERRTA
jgi:hypothetical protein